ncbi:primary-amine oxidase [Streptosporangium sp. NPDC049078]|uniref:primary-amine oxidase n=1 Tax=Streptosporangium sp. NPDC049078 TaxID=3155767 RepID=UPI003423E865
MTPLTTPVSSLTATEIEQTVTLVREAGLAGESVRFVYIGLLEPHKQQVLAFQAGTGPRPDRQARVLLLDTTTGDARDVSVDLTTGAVATIVDVDGSRGAMPIMAEEFMSVEGILAQEPAWVEALARRDLTTEQVRCAPLSAGVFGLPGEKGRRIIRVLCFATLAPDAHVWAHPVDGLSAYVDLIEKKATEVIDIGIFPLPQEPSTFHLPQGRPAPLETLKPIEITQPDGPSFQVQGDRITWANWSLHFGFDAREGLVLHHVAYTDPDHDGELRPVIYRASIAEMVVPYGDPAPVRFWQNYFDAGEYLFGRYANSLTHGCDCLGEIHYVDVDLADELGNVQQIPNAICLHEEDYGTLWKHTDIYTPNSAEVRRQRRLVISFFTTVGNYDYGFFWYLYLDGRIECEAKLTGILFTTAYRGLREWPYAGEVAPGLGAPFHQHLFSARLDMMVDGVCNAVDEVDAARVPLSSENPYGNAFSYTRTRIASEAQGVRSADASVGRTWHIVSTERTNRLGQPTGYVLRTEQNPTLLADPSSSIAARAAFTTRELWITRYASEERYPAGEFVNQNPGGDGLPAYVAGDRPLDGEDIVLWHTFGVTHFPRPEDWPVMPVDHARFSLTPYGFFDRNPTLNVPADTARHHGGPCHHGA